MKLSIDRTVDCSGLESGLRVAQRYRRCHRSFCDEVLTAAECFEVVRHPSAVMASVTFQSD